MRPTHRVGEGQGEGGGWDEGADVSKDEVERCEEDFEEEHQD